MLCTCDLLFYRLPLSCSKVLQFAIQIVFHPQRVIRKEAQIHTHTHTHIYIYNDSWNERFQLSELNCFKYIFSHLHSHFLSLQQLQLEAEVLSGFADGGKLFHKSSVSLRNTPMTTKWKWAVSCIKYYHNTDSDKWMYEFLCNLSLARLRAHCSAAHRKAELSNAGQQGGWERLLWILLCQCLSMMYRV